MARTGNTNLGKAAASRRKRTREDLNRSPFIAAAVPEREHFYDCAECGQKVDMRRLGDVLHHEEPDHEPIGDELRPAGSLKFIEPMLPALTEEPPDGDE
jgi:bifunctional non-homologous end joining protein LigD